MSKACGVVSQAFEKAGRPWGSVPHGRLHYLISDLLALVVAKFYGGVT